MRVAQSIGMGDSHLVTVAGALLLLTACSGQLFTEGGGGSTGVDGAAFDADRTNKPTVRDLPGDGPGSELVSCEPHVTQAPLQRLTRHQYANAVEVLTGVTLDAATSFVPDDRVDGFVANSVALVTEAHAFDYLEGAEEAAGAMDITANSGCGSDDTSCLKAFSLDFAERAVRRVLTPDERAGLTALFDAESDANQGARSIVTTALQLPQFLYRLEALGQSGDATVPLTADELAARLSLFLWDAPPDDELRNSAERGDLIERSTLESQARRMLGDPRADSVLERFYAQWLHTENLETESRADAAFTSDLKEGLRREVSLAGAGFTKSGGTLDDLLFSNVTAVNAALRSHYGAEVVGQAKSVTTLPSGFEWVELDGTMRRGATTSAGVMSALAHDGQTAPVFRGAFFLDRVLCSGLPPAPATVNAIPPEVDESVSVREQYAQHSADPTCASCHDQIDPIGFGLDVLDHLGRPRTTDDNGFAIDGAGQIVGSDVAGAFVGAAGLVDRLSTSTQVSRCMVQMWLTFALGRELGPEDQCTVDALSAYFEAQAGSLQDLLVGIVLSDAFRFWRVQS